MLKPRIFLGLFFLARDKGSQGSIRAVSCREDWLLVFLMGRPQTGNVEVAVATARDSLQKELTKGVWGNPSPEEALIASETDSITGILPQGIDPENDSCAKDLMAPGGRPPRVLIIDDELINVRVLGDMLGKAGFTTFIAGDGAQGRAIAAAECPDIILLDIMMPGEDGFRTMELLSQDRKTMDIPVIFISALTDAEHKVRGLTSGAVDYVTKPFERSEVLARIRIHLRLVQARRLIIQNQAQRLERLARAQQSILPDPKSIPEARFHVWYLPAQEAGGDFYDVFASEDAVHSYFVADICGHDLGASFITSSLKALVTQNSGPLYTPLETLKNINAVLRSILADGKFLTAQLLRVDRRKCRAELFSAGHPQAVYVPKGGEACYLEAQGDILGVFPSVYLTPVEWVVKPGDMIYLYTDGMVERFGENGAFEQRLDAELLALCGEHAGLGARQSVEKIRHGLLVKDGAPHDDMVLMAIEV